MKTFVEPVGKGERKREVRSYNQEGFLLSPTSVFPHLPLIKSLAVVSLVITSFAGCSDSSDDRMNQSSVSPDEGADQSDTAQSTGGTADGDPRSEGALDTEKPHKIGGEMGQATIEPELSAGPQSGDEPAEEHPHENSRSAERIEFTTDDIGTTIEGRILADDTGPLYVLRAKAEQLMELTLTSLEDNASVDVEAPNGEKLITGITRSKILLATDGDYLIYINPLNSNVSYSLDVLITQPVQYTPLRFEVGTSTIRVTGAIIRGETGPLYGLRAAAGQRMDITISSVEANASFDVLTPSGQFLRSEIEEEGFEFWAHLPESGEYLITTNGLRGNVFFTLDISIRDDIG